jgi:hypothetical protein
MDFRKIFKYKFSGKMVQLEPSWCMRTDGHDEVNRRFSHCCEGDYKLGSVKNGFAWLNKSVGKEHALTANVKAEFVPVRLSSLASAEELS